MIKTSRYMGLVLGSFLAPQADMIFGDGRCRSAGVRAWRCRSEEVRVWRCRSAGVKVWRCEDVDQQMWRCEDVDQQVWGCEDVDQQVWRCEDVDQQMWRCEDVDQQMWECEDVDHQMWRCEDVDQQMWRCEDVYKYDGCFFTKNPSQALSGKSPTAAAAGPSPRPDAAGERENPKNAGMDSSMLPNAARSYKDTTGNWEAGFFGNNWMVFVTLFVFTICLSLSLFLLPLPCHSSAGVWVRATDRELEGRGLEKNCPPSRSYRRGSWEAAESRSSSNKWLLREEVAERRGVSPQQRKVARPCSPIHPFIHPSIHSFIR